MSWNTFYLQKDLEYNYQIISILIYLFLPDFEPFSFQCLKFKTDKAQDLKKWEKLNLALMEKMSQTEIQVSYPKEAGKFSIFFLEENDFTL